MSDTTNYPETPTLEDIIAFSEADIRARLAALPLEELESLVQTQHTILRLFNTERREEWSAMQTLSVAELERRRSAA